MKQSWIATVGMASFAMTILCARPAIASAPPLSPAQIQQLKSTDSDHDGLSDYDELYIFHTDPIIQTPMAMDTLTGMRYSTGMTH